MLIGLVLIWGVAVLGIRLSVRSDLALLTFELGVLLVLALTILVKGAPGGDWHPHVFGFSPLPAFSLLSLVVTLCALGVYALAQFGLALLLATGRVQSVLARAGSDRCGCGHRLPVHQERVPEP
jgi:hypothetical protein